MDVHRVDASTSGIFGFVEFAVLREQGSPEDWSRTRRWIESKFLRLDPLAEFPAPIEIWQSFNGLATAIGPYLRREGDVGWQIDVRVPKEGFQSGLNRSQESSLTPLLADMEGALNEHVLSRKADLAYLGRLANRFEPYLSEWSRTVPWILNVRGGALSVNDVWAAAVISVAFDPSELLYKPTSWDAHSLPQVVLDHAERSQIEIPLILGMFGRGSISHLVAESLRTPKVVEVTVLTDELFVVKYERSEKAQRAVQNSQCFVKFSPDDSPIVWVRLPGGRTAVNSGHPFVQAILELPDEVAIGRQRILDALGGRDVGSAMSFSALVRAVATSVESPALDLYSQILEREIAGAPWLTRASLRIPRVPPTPLF